MFKIINGTHGAFREALFSPIIMIIKFISNINVYPKWLLRITYVINSFLQEMH